MIRNRLLTVAALLALAVSVSGCSCGGSSPNTDGGLPDGSVADAGDSGIPDAGPLPPDSGPGSICISSGASCSVDGGNVCCSGICGTNGTCTDATFCKGPQAACANSAECCTNSCVNGTCSSQTCEDVGQTCSSNAQCCTGTCGSDGKCASITGQTASCEVRGQACTDGSQCCSTNCQGGVCVPAYYCQSTNDICYSNAQCCNGLCSVTDGGAGVCQVPTSTGASQCIEDGNPCAGGTNCCSRTCIDPGSGATVCQPAGGCKLTGDTCFTDDQCCGGGVNPNGSVVCQGADPSTGRPGRCDQGSGCVSEGTICGAPVLPDGGSVNAQQDCCDGQKSVCKLDSSGLPRCFGGGGVCDGGYNGQTGCCIASGDTCQFSDQCCDGEPCIPNPDGGAGNVCASANTCLPLGANCMSPDGGNGGGCCAGSICGSSGEFGFVCQLPTTGPDGGTTDGGTTDGGTTDAGFCDPNGTLCTSAANCCSGICGVGADGGEQCLTPSACQQQSASCTATSDCCSGLSCQLNTTTGAGTCQPSTCPGAGQTCSPTTSCCSGLLCVDSNFQTCTGTSPCTCTVVIN